MNERKVLSAMNSEMLLYLQSTPTIDCDNSMVIKFAKENTGHSVDPKEQSISLYYAVRDGIWYDPYIIDLSVEGLRAGATLKKGRGWCISKAILLAACCRVIGVPARLGFADVQNHLSTKRMREQMKTSVFFWHGYTSIYLNGIWVKATPAFNIRLCERFKLKPLEFDGSNDSIFHSFDLEGKQHMEYLRYRGEYPDVPVDQIKETFQNEYASDLSFNKAGNEAGNKADFDHEVARETLDD